MEIFTHTAGLMPAPVGLGKPSVEPTSSAVSSGTAASAGAPLPSPTATSDRMYAREWLYRMVMFPSFFTPCHGCCMGNKTPKREQLLTHFDTQCPTRVYCSHCPEQKMRSPWLLQVRRSAFKDVVKASDICRFGCDVGGVQQYTLNGSKVLYLNREAAPERKGTPTSAAPATCIVDGRAMMDKNSQYCSLKCKMQGEDPDFTEWLNVQDPAVKEAAYAAAIAPPRPTVACKRAAPNGCPYSYGTATPATSGSMSPASSGGSGGAAVGAFADGSSARSRKAPRDAATESTGPGSAAAKPLAPPALKAPKVKLSPPAARAAAKPAAPPADRQAASAAHQSAFLAAAMDGPVLGGGLGGGASEWMSCGPLADLDQALSCSTEWGSVAAEAWGAGAPVGSLSVGDWSAPPAAAAEVGDWWLPAADEPAAPTAAAAPDAAAAPPLPLLDVEDCAEDHAGLLVEWPLGGVPLGSSTSELLHYGSAAASPGSEADMETAFLWN